mmetsp:Transcript_20424/g.29268  ORF Transcript_20424/g.29268 Transcript_20424/m.29268 type:complete len:401 (-) Transcript_20424:3134-4336(-)
MMRTLLFSSYFCITFGASIDVFAQWISLNFTWDEDHTYANYVSTNKFIARNCLLAGINVDIDESIYVTVPRWRSGVPATLNKLSVTNNTQGGVEYTLTPFPSWDMQKEGKSGDLQNVQSMTIDSKRRMWVIEVGRRNFFELNPRSIVNSPAGLWIIDMLTHEVTTKYYFPSDIVSYDNSFLNDVVVDDIRDIAYFTDAWGDGALIAFDLSTQVSKRFSGVSTRNDPTYSMIINGVNYGTNTFTTPSDGIALTSDREALFFCQVQGTTLYRVQTNLLMNSLFDSSLSISLDDIVEVIGIKEPSDGIKYLDGMLYWGALTQNSVYSVAINSTSLPQPSLQEAAKSTQQSADQMTWLDTFAVDLGQKHKLWFVSNRLNLYATYTMDFTGAQGANMHILTMDTA